MPFRKIPALGRPCLGFLKGSEHLANEYIIETAFWARNLVYLRQSSLVGEREMSIDQSGVQLVTITQPDDFHLHVRDGAALRSVVPHAAKQFRRAIIMPNLKPPVTTVKQVTFLKQASKE